MSLPFKSLYFHIAVWRRSRFWSVFTTKLSNVITPMSPSSNLPKKRFPFYHYLFWRRKSKNPKSYQTVGKATSTMSLSSHLPKNRSIRCSFLGSYLYSKHSENTHLKSLSLSFQFALAVDFNSSVYVWTHLPCQHGWVDSHFGPWVIQPWDFAPPPCQICDETFEKQCSITFKQQVDTIEQKRYNCANVKSKNTI